MKKILSFILVLSLLLSFAVMFSACGESDNTASTDSLTASSADADASTESTSSAPELKQLNPKKDFETALYETLWINNTTNVFKDEGDDSVMYVSVSFWDDGETAIFTHFGYLTRDHYSQWVGSEVDEENLPKDYNEGEDREVKVIDGVKYYRKQSYYEESYVYELTETEVILKDYDTNKPVAKFTLYEDNSLVLTYSDFPEYFRVNDIYLPKVKK